MWACHNAFVFFSLRPSFSLLVQGFVTVSQVTGIAVTLHWPPPGPKDFPVCHIPLWLTTSLCSNYFLRRPGGKSCFFKRSALCKAINSSGFLYWIPIWNQHQSPALLLCTFSHGPTTTATTKSPYSTVKLWERVIDLTIGSSHAAICSLDSFPPAWQAPL